MASRSEESKKSKLNLFPKDGDFESDLFKSSEPDKLPAAKASSAPYNMNSSSLNAAMMQQQSQANGTSPSVSQPNAQGVVTPGLVGATYPTVGATFPKAEEKPAQIQQTVNFSFNTPSKQPGLNSDTYKFPEVVYEKKIISPYFRPQVTHHKDSDANSPLQNSVKLHSLGHFYNVDRNGVAFRISNDGKVQQTTLKDDYNTITKNIASEFKSHDKLMKEVEEDLSDARKDVKEMPTDSNQSILKNLESKSKELSDKRESFLARSYALSAEMEKFLELKTNKKFSDNEWLDYDVINRIATTVNSQYSRTFVQGMADLVSGTRSAQDKIAISSVKKAHDEVTQGGVTENLLVPIENNTYIPRATRGITDGGLTPTSSELVTKPIKYFLGNEYEPPRSKGGKPVSIPLDGLSQLERLKIQHVIRNAVGDSIFKELVLGESSNVTGEKDKVSFYEGNVNEKMAAISRMEPIKDGPTMGLGFRKLLLDKNGNLRKDIAESIDGSSLMKIEAQLAIGRRRNSYYLKGLETSPELKEARIKRDREVKILEKNMIETRIKFPSATGEGPMVAQARELIIAEAKSRQNGGDGDINFTTGLYTLLLGGRATAHEAYSLVDSMSAAIPFYILGSAASVTPAAPAAPLLFQAGTLASAGDLFRRTAIEAAYEQINYQKNVQGLSDEQVEVNPNTVYGAAIANATVEYVLGNTIKKSMMLIGASPAGGALLAKFKGKFPEKIAAIFARETEGMSVLGRHRAIKALANRGFIRTIVSASGDMTEEAAEEYIQAIIGVYARTDGDWSQTFSDESFAEAWSVVAPTARGVFPFAAFTGLKTRKNARSALNTIAYLESAKLQLQVAHASAVKDVQDKHSRGEEGYRTKEQVEAAIAGLQEKYNNSVDVLTSDVNNLTAASNAPETGTTQVEEPTSQVDGAPQTAQSESVQSSTQSADNNAYVELEKNPDIAQRSSSVLTDGTNTFVLTGESHQHMQQRVIPIDKAIAETESELKKEKQELERKRDERVVMPKLPDVVTRESERGTSTTEVSISQQQQRIDGLNQKLKDLRSERQSIEKQYINEHLRLNQERDKESARAQQGSQQIGPQVSENPKPLERKSSDVGRIVSMGGKTYKVTSVTGYGERALYDLEELSEDTQKPLVVEGVNQNKLYKVSGKGLVPVNKITSEEPKKQTSTTASVAGTIAQPDVIQIEEFSKNFENIPDDKKSSLKKKIEKLKKKQKTNNIFSIKSDEARNIVKEMVSIYNEHYQTNHAVYFDSKDRAVSSDEGGVVILSVSAEYGHALGTISQANSNLDLISTGNTVTNAAEGHLVSNVTKGYWAGLLARFNRKAGKTKETPSAATPKAGNTTNTVTLGSFADKLNIDSLSVNELDGISDAIKKKYKNIANLLSVFKNYKQKFKDKGTLQNFFEKLQNNEFGQDTMQAAFQLGITDAKGSGVSTFTKALEKALKNEELKKKTISVTVVTQSSSVQTATTQQTAPGVATESAPKNDDLNIRTVLSYVAKGLAGSFRDEAKMRAGIAQLRAELEKMKTKNIPKDPNAKSRGSIERNNILVAEKKLALKVLLDLEQSLAKTNKDGSSNYRKSDKILKDIFSYSGVELQADLEDSVKPKTIKFKILKSKTPNKPMTQETKDKLKEARRIKSEERKKQKDEGADRAEGVLQDLGIRPNIPSSILLDIRPLNQSERSYLQTREKINDRLGEIYKSMNETYEGLRFITGRATKEGASALLHSFVFETLHLGDFIHYALMGTKSLAGEERYQNWLNRSLKLNSVFLDFVKRFSSPTEIINNISSNFYGKNISLSDKLLKAKSVKGVLVGKVEENLKILFTSFLRDDKSMENGKLSDRQKLLQEIIRELFTPYAGRFSINDQNMVELYGPDGEVTEVISLKTFETKYGSKLLKELTAIDGVGETDADEDGTGETENASIEFGGFHSYVKSKVLNNPNIVRLIAYKFSQTHNGLQLFLNTSDENGNPTSDELKNRIESFMFNPLANVSELDTLNDNHNDIVMDGMLSPEARVYVSIYNTNGEFLGWERAVDENGIGVNGYKVISNPGSPDKITSVTKKNPDTKELNTHKLISRLDVSTENEVVRSRLIARMFSEEEKELIHETRREAIGSYQLEVINKYIDNDQIMNSKEKEEFRAASVELLKIRDGVSIDLFLMTYDDKFIKSLGTYQRLTYKFFSKDAWPSHEAFIKGTKCFMLKDGHFIKLSDEEVKNLSQSEVQSLMTTAEALKAQITLEVLEEVKPENTPTVTREDGTKVPVPKLMGNFSTKDSGDNKIPIYSNHDFLNNPVKYNGKTVSNIREFVKLYAENSVDALIESGTERNRRTSNKDSSLTEINKNFDTDTFLRSDTDTGPAPLSVFNPRLSEKKQINFVWRAFLGDYSLEENDAAQLKESFVQQLNMWGALSLKKEIAEALVPDFDLALKEQFAPELHQANMFLIRPNQGDSDPRYTRLVQSGMENGIEYVQLFDKEDFDNTEGLTLPPNYSRIMVSTHVKRAMQQLLFQKDVIFVKDGGIVQGVFGLFVGAFSAFKRGNTVLNLFNHLVQMPANIAIMSYSNPLSAFNPRNWFQAMRMLRASGLTKDTYLNRSLASLDGHFAKLYNQIKKRLPWDRDQDILLTDIDMQAMYSVVRELGVVDKGVELESLYEMVLATQNGRLPFAQGKDGAGAISNVALAGQFGGDKEIFRKTMDFIDSAYSIYDRLGKTALFWSEFNAIRSRRTGRFNLEFREAKNEWLKKNNKTEIPKEIVYEIALAVENALNSKMSDEAAAKTLQLYPSVRNVPQPIKTFSNLIPILGPFVQFTYETARIIPAAFRVAAQERAEGISIKERESKSENPDMTIISYANGLITQGTARMFNSSIALTLGATFSQYIMKLITFGLRKSISLVGLSQGGDDEEKRKNKRIENALRLSREKIAKGALEGEAEYEERVKKSQQYEDTYNAILYQENQKQMQVKAFHDFTKVVLTANKVELAKGEGFLVLTKDEQEYFKKVFFAGSSVDGYSERDLIGVSTNGNGGGNAKTIASSYSQPITHGVAGVMRLIARGRWSEVDSAVAQVYKNFLNNEGTPGPMLKISRILTQDTGDYGESTASVGEKALAIYKHFYGNAAKPWIEVGTELFAPGNAEQDKSTGLRRDLVDIFTRVAGIKVDSTPVGVLPGGKGSPDRFFFRDLASDIFKPRFALKELAKTWSSSTTKMYDPTEDLKSEYFQFEKDTQNFINKQYVQTGLDIAKKMSGRGKNPSSNITVNGVLVNGENFLKSVRQSFDLIDRDIDGERIVMDKNNMVLSILTGQDLHTTTILENISLKETSAKAYEIFGTLLDVNPETGAKGNRTMGVKNTLEKRAVFERAVGTYGLTFFLDSFTGESVITSGKSEGFNYYSKQVSNLKETLLTLISSQTKDDESFDNYDRTISKYARVPYVGPDKTRDISRLARLTRDYASRVSRASNMAAEEHQRVWNSLSQSDREKLIMGLYRIKLAKSVGGGSININALQKEFVLENSDALKRFYASTDTED